MEENRNAGGSQEVKLVFDVMPEAGETEVPVRPAASAPQPPPAPATQPGVVGTPPPVPPRPRPEAASPVSRIITLVIILVVLAAGGFFAYRYFFSGEISSTPEIPKPQPPVTKNPLPKEWLQKYFNVETCTDQSLCGPEADPDSDGLTNADEFKYNTNPLLADTDYDGLSDGDEIHIYTTDPVVADTDGDGVEDGVEVRSGRNPTINSSSPATALEKQQWDEAIAKYGQHEPTQTFLSFVEFYTIFKPTTTPQLTMSVPPDWKFDSVNYTDTVKTVKSPDGKSRVILRSGLLYRATTTEQSIARIRTKLKAEPSYQSIRSAQQTIAGRLESIEEYQYRRADSPPVHALLFAIPKGTFVHTVTVEIPEADWPRWKEKALVMLQSVR